MDDFNRLALSIDIAVSLSADRVSCYSERPVHTVWFSIKNTR